MALKERLNEVINKKKEMEKVSREKLDNSIFY